MYESPITKYMSDVETQIQEQETERMMLTVSRAVGYDVDKTELLKALQYDREQYTKGYRDGRKDMLNEIKEKIQKTYENTGFSYLLVALEKIDNLIESEGK